MTNQTTAELIATAKAMREQLGDDYPKPWSILALWFETAARLEAAEQERDEARKAAEDHVLDADAVHVRLSAELREVNRERDNWRLSAEEAERAEKRWKDCAVEADRQARAAEAEAEHLHLEDTREIVALTQERDEARLQEASLREDVGILVRERAALAAVVEKVRAWADEAIGYGEPSGDTVSDLLATTPADILREVKAEAWQEGAYRVYNSTLDEAEWWWSDWASENPYRTREEQDRG